MPKLTTSYQTNQRLRRTVRKKRAGSQSVRLRPSDKNMPDLRHSQGFGKRAPKAPRRRRDSRLTYVFIAVGAAVVVFVASIVWYLNRPVTITLNDAEASVRINSTIEQVISSQGLELKPGDLLAVDDSVLEEDAGDPYAVTVDGKKISVDDAATLELHGGEKVVVEDGDDTYEEHSVDATSIEPQLTVEGDGPVQYVETWGVPGRSEVWTGAVSGKTQDRGVVREVQDCVVRCESVIPDDEDNEYIALTFNGSPSSETEEILAVLKEKGVTATFFMAGEDVEADEGTAKRIVDAGCEVGSMGLTGDGVSDLDSVTLREQLEAGFDALETATGSPSRLFRGPLESFGDAQWAAAMDLVACNVQWNIDSGDWLEPGADTIASNVLDYASNGSIVLLTDGATDGQMLEALPMIIDGLLDDGYRLVTVTELIATDDDMPTRLAKAEVGMPRGAALPTPQDSEGETDDSDAASSEDGADAASNEAGEAAE